MYVPGKRWLEDNCSVATEKHQVIDLRGLNCAYVKFLGAVRISMMDTIPRLEDTTRKHEILCSTTELCIFPYKSFK